MLRRLLTTATVAAMLTLGLGTVASAAPAGISSPPGEAQDAGTLCSAGELVASLPAVGGVIAPIVAETACANAGNFPGPGH